jgi:hypothetical protein
MKHHPLRTILGRPALHLLLTCAFIAAFCWPILAMTRPAQTFHFLYVSWFISLLALFAISRAAPVESAQALNQQDHQADGDGSNGQGEITRESL